MIDPFADDQGSEDSDKAQEGTSAAHESQNRYAVESSHEILSDAFFSNTRVIQEELASALGSKELEGDWMKRSSSDRRRLDSEDSDDEQGFTEYPEYPDVNDTTYDIPLITFNSSGSPAEDAAALESGTYQTPDSKKLGIDTKFSNILTRISDRIAGSNNPPTPSTDKPATFAESIISDTSDLLTGSTSTHSPSAPGSPYINTTEVTGDNLSIYSQTSSPKKDMGRRHLNISVPTLQKSTSNIVQYNEGSIWEPRSPRQPGFDHLYLYGRSLGIFPPTSKLRIWCHRLASHSRVNSFLLLLLFLQTGLLIFRQWNPSALGGYVYEGNNLADYMLIGVNIIYTLEAALKIIAYGLIDDKVMFKELGLEYPGSWYSQTLMRYIGDIKKIFRSPFTNTSNSKVGAQKEKELSEPTSHSSSVLDEDSQQEIPLEENVDSPVNCFEDPVPLGSDTSSFQRAYTVPKVRVSRQNSSASISGGHARPQIIKNNIFFKANEIRKKMDDMNLRRAYLKNNWQKLDAISTGCFWVSLLFSINRFDVNHHFMLFRSLSCLRIMRLCNLTAGTNIILKSCYSAIPQLIDISLVIICFWVIFGIIGVQSFKSSLSRACLWTNPLDASETYRNDGQYCGSYIGLDGLAKPYLYRDGTPSSDIKGFRCPMYSVCQSGENPYSGTVNFDNIFQSMELVFVVMSVNAFSDLMYDLMDSDNLGSALFFIFAIFILTVWLMNIFIAIIVSSFKIVQMEQEEEYRQRAERGVKLSFAKFWTIRKERHSKSSRAVIDKKKWLQWYYKYEYFFVIVITSDLITQCLRSSTMSDDMKTTLYRFELISTSILLAEILLRFALYLPHWRVFFSSRVNCCDLILGIITMIIIIDPVRKSLGHVYFWLSFFQIARFYRVVLAHSVTRDLWLKILRNAKAIFDLTLFYFLLLSVVSIILARYFEGTVPNDAVDNLQFAMNTLPNSFMSLYVITSTENWADIMYGLQEYSSSPGQRAIGSIFIIFWFIVSNSIVMNIFIAVIANAFQVSEEGKRKHQLRQFIDDVTTKLQTVQPKNDWINKLKSRFFKSNTERNLEKAVTNLLLSGSAVNDFLENDEGEIEDLEAENLTETKPPRSRRLTKWIKRLRPGKSHEANPFFDKKKKEIVLQGSFDPATFAKKALEERQRVIKEQDQYLKENPQFNSVFYVLEPNNRLRRFCQRIVPSSFGERIDGIEPNKKVSEAFALLMFLSTIGIVITACYLTPLFRREVALSIGQWNWTFYIDLAFTAVFTLEFFIKITADGVSFSPNGYFRSPWNWIDFVALSSLWIETVAFVKSDGNLSRIVSGLKAMRALRILTISETARNNFQYTMISGFGKIVSAAVISVTLIYPFSIWALNIFAGRLGYCNDGESYMADCINEYQSSVYNWDVYSPRVYVQPLLHMDDFSSSFSSLYQIVSLEGWTDLLINVMQSTGEGTPQVMFYNVFNGAFIILFNFLSVVFILTLFVSVIIDNYSKVTGRGYLTEAQIQWYHVKRFLLQVKPSKRKNPEALDGIRKFCYNMTVGKNKVWNSILNVMICFHVLLLLCETFPGNETFNQFRVGCFIFNSSFFVANYAMLAVAQSYKVFITNKWNIISSIVSVGAWLSTILTYVISSGSAFSNINKTFLVSMMLFMFPRSDKIDQILKFASASLPRIISLMFTWFVIFLVYAIAMNQIFGMTKFGPNTTDNINVRSVPKALILLFRCSLGEGWNYIMDDFTLEEPFCTPSTRFNDSDCGNKQYAYLMFMSWNVISMYIMLNLFVSVILDSFSYISGGSNYAQLVSRSEIRNFKRAWEKFDPDGTGFIDPADLPKLLQSLDGALSFHFYYGVLSVSELTSKWIVRNNPSDPYDITVDYDTINEIIDLMDVPKIRERRALYERFVEEAIMNMDLHDEEGISFTRLLVQIPLYNSFDSGQCLTLIDYLERRLLIQKLNVRLQKRRCKELIIGYLDRTRYLRHKRQSRHSVNSSHFSADSYNSLADDVISL